MAQRYFIGGNWKLNGTRESIEALVKTYNDGGEFPASVEVVVAPTALHIGYCMENMRKDVAVAAQNISTDKGFGPMTGELSAELFKGWNVEWTLTGHSERRRRQQIRQLGHDEESKSVANKTAHALSVGMNVILCVGETLTDREAGKTLEVCFEQLAAVAELISTDAWSRIVVAYEPVWAIGTGVTATPDQAQEVHAALRKWLMTNLSDEIAEATRIIYGGSVKSGNASGLIARDDIDGFLVGGASMSGDFVEIIKACPPAWNSGARAENRLKRKAALECLGADGKPLKK